MKGLIDSAIKKYADFVSYHPFKVLFLVLILTVLAVVQAGNVSTKSMDNEDVIPDTYPVKEAFDIIGNDFGGRDSIMISIELKSGSRGGVNDLREPEIINYINKLSVMANELRGVENVNSLSTLLKRDNNGRLPKEKSTIKRTISNNLLYLNYISEDYTHSIISLMLQENFDDDEIINELKALTDNIEKPVPLEVGPAGQIATGPIVEDTLGPDMQTTSTYAIIGIILVLILLFGSVSYSFTTLSVIIAGIIWSYGYFGFTGVEISPATTGAMTMIMGIGIDFGIQTIKRFRQELETKKPSPAMAETVYRVFAPMFIAASAAVIGFRAMTMGDLTVMEELGTLLSYGIMACFIAAITVVPSVSVIGEKIKFNKKRTEV
ncbi:MAG: MMPL family transporter [Nanoarchaeota archaeon]